MDVFLSNGVEAARDIDTFDTLYRLSENIAAASTARGGRRAASSRLTSMTGRRLPPSRDGRTCR